MKRPIQTSPAALCLTEQGIGVAQKSASDTIVGI
jgi:hypothetical protein